MNLKNFLKPTKIKIVVFLVLFAISFLAYLVLPSWLGPLGPLDKGQLGLPLRFFDPGGCVDISPLASSRVEFVGPDAEPGPRIVCSPMTFNVAAFTIDLAFWYLISALIVFLYNKRRV